MTILVTGATGFLGSALTTELIKQKETVRILARDEQKARAQFGDTVTIIRGEITDVEQVERAVDGATIIYHLVGRLYHPSIPAELYHYIHVEGTRIIAEAVRSSNVVKAIACKQNIVLVNIHSTRMLMAHGFLRRIFEILSTR